MQNRIHHESIADRRERKLVQANFSDTQAAALSDILANLATKKDLSEFRTETRENFLEFRDETKENLSKFQTEAKENLSEFRTETKENFLEFQTEAKENLSEFRTETRENSLEFQAETKENLSEFRTETRERFARIETRLDNTATKKEVANMMTKDDWAQLKDDLNKKYFQLLMFLPFITIALVSATLALGAYLTTLIT